jgi:hypothetical protein
MREASASCSPHAMLLMGKHLCMMAFGIVDIVDWERTQTFVPGVMVISSLAALDMLEAGNISGVSNMSWKAS